MSWLHGLLIIVVLGANTVLASAVFADVSVQAQTQAEAPASNGVAGQLLEGFGTTQDAQRAGPNNTRSGFDGIIQQWEYIRDWRLLASVFIGLVVAALCAMMISWQPGAGNGSADPTIHEERKALIALGVLGAMVANIVEVSPPMALVIFGIGGLIRFRTVFERPKVTARAIGVVVIGLACGLNLIALAILLALFFWVLLLVMESKPTVEVTLHVDPSRETKAIIANARACLVDAGLQVFSTSANRTGTQVTVTAQLDSSVTGEDLAQAIKQSLPPGEPVVIHWTTK